MLSTFLPFYLLYSVFSARFFNYSKEHKHLIGARTPCGDVHARAMATAMEIAKMPTCLKDPAPE